MSMLNNAVGYWAYSRGTYIRGRAIYSGTYIRGDLYSGGGGLYLE